MDQNLLPGETGRNSERSYTWVVYVLFGAALLVAAVVAAVKFHAMGKAVAPIYPGALVTTEEPVASEQEQPTPAPATETAPDETPLSTPAEATRNPFVKTAIIIDGQQSRVLTSRQAAESLMDSVSNYFESLDIIPPGAVTELSNTVELVDADAEAETTDYDSAFAYFTGNNTPLKYVSYVTFYQDNPITHTDEVKYSDDLPYGYRLVKVYGMDGVKRITYASTYINGMRKEIIEREQFVVYPAIDGEILVGTARYSAGSVPPVSYGDEVSLPVGLALKTPLSGTVARFYGMYSDEFNHGIDIVCAVGSEVYSAGAGTVVSIMERGSYGLTVEIDHGRGVTTRYAHLDVIGVALGDRVAAGVAIGTVADSITYPHLHFELRIRGYSYNPLKALMDTDKLDLSYGISG